MLRISKFHINVGKEYFASPNTIWNLITDTIQWPRWGPTVKAVRSSERYICNGSSGQVLTPIGLWLPFSVTEYEHESFWNWKVAYIKATGHRLQPSENGGCSLWFEVPIVAVPYLVVCQMALDRIGGIVDSEF